MAEPKFDSARLNLPLMDVFDHSVMRSWCSVCGDDRAHEFVEFDFVDEAAVFECIGCGTTESIDLSTH